MGTPHRPHRAATASRALRRPVVAAACGLAVLLLLLGAAIPGLAARMASEAAGAGTSALAAHRANSPHAATPQPIKHIVFIMEENRSFDNIFGRFPGADGATTASVSIGGHLSTIPLVPEPYYLWHDLGHDWGDAAADIDRGKMDGFSHETYSDLFGDLAAYQQLMPADVPNLYAYAHHFTLADRAFAPVPGPTFPVHLHMVAAQDGGVIGNPQNTANAWGCDSPSAAVVLRQTSPGHIVKSFPCFTYATLAGELTRAHLSWAYYAAPPSDLGYMWSTLDAFKKIRESPQWPTHVKDEQTFEADARAGRLPAFSWVTPRADVSMHPPAPVCPAENWLVGKINAVMHGPDWPSTLIVVAWDDWGGFYDHVAPPPRPAGAYGLRVPMLIISPYARSGYVSHTVYTFESVLKTAEDLWHLPALTEQDLTAHSLLDSLDFSQAPAAPFLLHPRACPAAPTPAGDRALLEQALEKLLTSRLGLSIGQIEALHRTLSLPAIATMRHVDPKRLAADMKTIAAAWAGGEVMLQFIGPLQEPRQVYLAETNIDRLFQASPGTRLFPLVNSQQSVISRR